MARKSTGRDNFTKGTIDILRLRVAARCSNPDCRTPTTGPVTDKTKISSIGQAAHITAASLGGPRYDHSMTPEERKDIDNGIWLCQNCATKIDRDAQRYTVALLKSWKGQAEATANAEQGKPSTTVAERELFHAGLLRQPIYQFVGSALTSMRETIAKIDPRFSVDIQMTSVQTSIVLHAKEPVLLNANVAPAYHSEFETKMQGLVEHGQSLVMDASAIRFEGSRLLDLIRDEAQTLSISSTLRRTAVQKIVLHDPAGRFIAMNEFVGHVTAGTKSFTFEGSALGDLLHLRYRFDFSQGGKSRNQPVEWTFNYGVWDGCSTLELPFFEKMYSYMKAFRENWWSSWTLEIEGRDVLTGRGSGLSFVKNAPEEFALLNYIKCIRELITLLQIKVPFSKTPISHQDITAVCDLWSLLCELPRRKGKDIGKITSGVTPENKAQAVSLQENILDNTPKLIKVEHQFNEPFNLLGTLVKVAPVNLYFSKMQLTITDKFAVQSRKTVNTVMTPEDDCTVAITMSEKPYMLVRPSIAA